MSAFVYQMPSIDAFLSPSALWNPVHIISDCSRGMAVVVCVAGIVTNTIVIVTFARMRLRDSVTVFFFNIAIADLLCVTSGLAYNFRYFVHSYWCFYHDGLCNFFKLAISSMVLICSSGVLMKVVVYFTVSLGLQMCLCVASPRRFKVVFNRRTTSAVMLTIWALSSTVLGLNLYFEWRSVDIYYEFDQQSFKSTGDGKATLLHDVEVIADDCLRPVYYVTVAICASFLLYRLRKSVRLGHRKVNLNTAAGKDVNTHDSFNVIDNKHWD